jgi:hypothetical protein
LVTRDYTLLIYDTRYSVPTLNLIEAESADEACDVAVDVIKRSQHHAAVDLWDGEVRIFHVGAPTVSSVATLDEALKIAPPSL